MIKGDTLTIAILFGACDAFGNVMGEIILAYIPDHIAMYSSICAIMLSTTMLKLVPLGQVTIYIVLLIQIFFCGVVFNLIFIL